MQYERKGSVILLMDWKDILAVTGPLVVAVAAWFLNESSKSKWELHKRKEERYVALLESLIGFYESDEVGDNKAKKSEFLNQLNLAWLYCPDEVIRKTNGFLDTVSIGSPSSDEEKEQAVREFVLELRRDLLGRGWLRRTKTELTTKEFQILRST